MIDFDFINPTRIVFGRQSEEKIGELLISYGLRNVLIVDGGGSIKKSGLYGRVINCLEKQKITYCELSGIRANPDVSFVRSGVKLAKENNVDGLLAIGGGSVIDTAKSIGVSCFYPGDPFDFNLHKAIPKKCLPLAVILTIAASGSESSDSCVISDDATKVKMGFNHPIIRPLLAIEDPELTYTVGPYQTAVGVSDIMMHSIERYFESDEKDALCDEWSLALIKHVMENGLIALNNPADYEARAALMLDSSLSHDGLTGIGKKGPFVIHPLEHALSGYRPEITHGAGVALLWPAWADYVYRKAEPRFAKFARAIFNIEERNDEKAAIIGINRMREFFSSIGMPMTLQEVGLTKADISKLADLASGNGTRVVGCYPQSLDKADIEAIFVSCLR